MIWKGKLINNNSWSDLLFYFQKGNVLQVMPTAIPNGSFTIHARVEVTSNNGDEMVLDSSNDDNIALFD